MANSISLVTKFLPLIDEIYAAEAKTSVLEKPEFVQYLDGAREVKIMKLAIEGLGDYSRENGYAKGAISATWETHELSYDRGRKFILDKMDNEETMGLTLGAAMKEFHRTKVAPEIDALRFAELASIAGFATSGNLTASNASDAIDDAIAAMKEAEVPLEGGYLFITPTVKKYVSQSANYVKNINGAVKQGRTADFDTYETLKVIEVPQTRFYTAIELYDGVSTGETAGGYEKTPAGKDINFMIVANGTALPVIKHNSSNLIDGSKDSGDYDAWVLKYRLYHDIFVPQNKAKGIYLHSKN